MLIKIDSTIIKDANSFAPKQSFEFITNWYVFYTCPRAEKVVYNELVRSNYEVFLPVTKSLRFWKNRQKKWIEQVLFPGYIFVNAQESELHKIARTSRIVTYIHIGGKPSIIPSKEIEGIRKMLNLGESISVETNLKEGEKVRIIEGPFIGHEGILLQQKGKSRFGIQLKEINHAIFVDICTSALVKI
jgi:transcription antitermination factor NusG